MKFQAPTGITYEALVTNARQELRAASPEAYKLFLLCLCAGLRRGEAERWGLACSAAAVPSLSLLTIRQQIRAGQVRRGIEGTE